MRPRQNAIVVTRRPELRFVLPFVVRAKFRTAKTLAEFVAQMTGDIRAIIIDRRDSPITATKVERFLNENHFAVRLVFITARVFDRRDGAVVVNDGKETMSQLRAVMPIVLAGKPGPKKGSHPKNVRIEEVGRNSMHAVS
jgi:hypothetical protein